MRVDRLVHAVQHVLGVLAAAQQHRPLDRSRCASPRATAPRRGVYASTTLATLRTSTGVPFVRLHDRVLDVARRAQVAAAAHHELRSRRSCR